MKIHLRTTLTPTLTVYDSTAQDQSLFARLLKPQIIATTDEGTVLYEYGETPKSIFTFLVLAGFGLIIFRALK